MVVWRLTLAYFLIQIGFYGINIWLPHVIKTITSGSSLEVGLITAIPPDPTWEASCRM